MQNPGFNGLPHTGETVETVPRRPKPLFTQLKQGVNESALSRRQGFRQSFRQSRMALLRAAPPP